MDEGRRHNIDRPRSRSSGAKALALILAVHVALLAWGDAQHSPSWDEIGHMPAGVTHWRTGQFALYRVNPPLVRTWAAIPVLIAGFIPPSSSLADLLEFNEPRVRAEFACGRDLIQRNGVRSFWLFTLARWWAIPLSLVGCCVCFAWGRALYGTGAGVLAAAAWCFCPSILAHGQMITPDVGSASLGAAAGFCLWRWLRTPVWHRAIAGGVVLGLAELTKATWIVLFVLWPVLWLAWQTGERGRPRRVGWPRQAAQLALMLGIAVYVLNLGYAFEGTGKRLGEYAFVSATLKGSADATTGTGNRFAGSGLGCVPVPLPENYIQGIDLQKYEFEFGYWSYLRGEWRYGGWWWFYIYGLAVKVPLGTWGIILAALGVTVFGRGYSAGWRDELVLLAPAVAVLLLVSSQTGFNHHLRYVLPIMPLVFIWMSKVARAAQRGNRPVACAAAGLLACSIASSLWIYPHSLSYFNEAVGGPKNGQTHLLDSNIDWGQDLILLKTWLEGHPEVQPLGLAYSLPRWLLDPKDVGVDYVAPPPDPQANFFVGPPPEQFGPQPGWYAIFVRELYERHGAYAYFRRFQPEFTLGYTVYVYHISQEQAAAALSEQATER